MSNNSLSNVKKSITPLISKLREKSSTLIIFPSAKEDITLNLNNSGNTISISHYALMELDSNVEIKTETIAGVVYNTKVVPNLDLENIYKILQYYTMNSETVLLNDDDYNRAEATTVSEAVWFNTVRQFWPKSKLHVFASVSAGNNNNSDFGLYNETYVNIPSNYGSRWKTFTTPGDKAIIEAHELTDNVVEGGTGYHLSQGVNAQGANIYVMEGRPLECDLVKLFGLTFANGESQSYVFESNGTQYLGDNVKKGDYDPATDGYFKNSVYSVNKSYDKFQQSEQDAFYQAGEDFKFNVVLIYYSVYDSTGVTRKPLATNLFGVLFLDNDGGYISTFNKRKSETNKIGNGYSFRINIKSGTVYDNTSALIEDNTTTNAMMAEDMNTIMEVLHKCVDNMNVNVETTKRIQTQYALMLQEIKSLQGFKDDVLSLKNEVAELKRKLKV